MAQLSTYLLSVLNGKSDDIDIQDEFIKLLKVSFMSLRVLFLN